MTSQNKKNGPTPRPILERITDKVEFSDNGCWYWRGTMNSNGYGIIKVGSMKNYTRRFARVHRVLFELLRGPITEGLVLDHICHNADSTCSGGVSCPHRRCINPDHLTPTTLKENLLNGRGGRAGGLAIAEKKRLARHGSY